MQLAHSTIDFYETNATPHTSTRDPLRLADGDLMRASALPTVLDCVAPLLSASRREARTSPGASSAAGCDHFARCSVTDGTRGSGGAAESDGADEKGRDATLTLALEESASAAVALLGDAEATEA